MGHGPIIDWYAIFVGMRQGVRVFEVRPQIGHDPALSWALAEAVASVIRADGYRGTHQMMARIEVRGDLICVPAGYFGRVA